jgi:hypothetical protein
MYLRYRQFHIVSSPYQRRKLTDITPEMRTACENALDSLATMSDGFFSWILSGGLSIPFSTGTWYRAHHDIDVLILDNNLPAMVSRMRAVGYNLFWLPVCVRLPFLSTIKIYKTIAVEEVLQKKIPQVYLIRIDERGQIREDGDILHHLDTYIYTTDRGSVQSYKFPKHFPASYLDGHTYTTLSGHPIKIVNLKYIQKIKSISLQTVDRHDLRKIKEWVRSELTVVD